MLLALAGGVGLFLLGIHMLTDGIRSVSGTRLRHALQRFASGRLPAAATGLGVTAVIQSANATLMMTMGFVAAGLMGLPEALAVAVGAHVGTTSTAWLVAGFGLRFSLAPSAFVALLAGAVLRVAGRGTWRGVGTVTAGFGLLLLGISSLQDGMSSLAPDLRAALPEGGFLSAVALVGVGVLATVAAQSSSVAIAATLTASAAGGLALDQGALLIVGHNLGTAVPVFLASMGAGPDGRRVAIGHSVTTGVTAAVALLLLAPFLAVAGRAGPSDPVTLALFHTVLNLAGAALLLPLTPVLARAVVRWVPDHGPGGGLDPLAAKHPAAALAAARAAVAELTLEATGVLRSRVQHGPLARGTERRLEAAEAGWDRVRTFLAGVGPAGRGDPAYGHVVRALDHLEGLLEDCHAPGLRAEAFAGVRVATLRFEAGLQDAAAWAERAEGPPDAALEDLGALRAMVDERRTEVLTDTTMGKEDLVAALAELDALRWMADQAWHLERILGHLAGSGGQGEDGA